MSRGGCLSGGLQSKCGEFRLQFPDRHSPRTDLVVRVLDAPALRALEQEEPAAALELWRSMARAASEDLETALRANIGWEPGDHWNETPVED